MKKLILLLLFPLTLFAQSAIVTRPNTCRLGDQFNTISHALYLSYKHDLPLYISPFKNSELFYLHVLYPSSKRLPKTFKNEIIAVNHSNINQQQPNTLYSVPFYVDNYMRPDNVHQKMTPDYQDPEFLHLLETALSPLKPVKIITPPSNKVSIAIHLRTGEGFDRAGIRTREATKFTCQESCLKMLKWLQEHYLSDQELYVYIFSDVKRPKKMLKWFKEYGPKGIEWNTTLYNKTTDALLSDLFSMAKFDYLIRPSSNFSLISQILGNHKRILISTNAHYVETADEVVVDDFISVTRDEFFETYFNPDS